nr:hypothetical protein [Tanacetum cinerariifolium]
IERLKQGESINVQDLETNLFWEFGKFTSLDGESLESYYSRFYKLMNDLIRNKSTMTNHQVNVQFLLQLQPEWQRFVTLVKQSQELKHVSYHKLYDILKQHQHENSSTRTHQSATRKREKTVVNSPQPIYDQEPSMVHDDDKDTSKDKEIDKLMALISLSFKKIYKPTNNNLRTSSNTSRANQDNSPQIHRNAGYEGQRSGTVAGARDTIGSSMVQKTGIQCYNCKEYGHVARECQKPKRAKDAAYHREKMLLRMGEEFTQSIRSFIEDKKNLALHIQGKKKAIPLVILSVRFTKLIIHHLQSKHKVHPRPNTPLNLPYEEYVLGYLKFSANGTIQEILGMPILNEIITDDIQGSDHDSPTPKPAMATKPKATKQSMPSVPKEAPGKGKEKVIEEKVTHYLLDLNTPKKKSTTNQYILQRRTPKTAVPTGPSTHHEDEKATRADVETDTKDLVTHTEKSSEEMSNTVVLGTESGRQDEKQGGPDSGNSANSRPLPSQVILTGSSLDLIDEWFIATAYPNVHENLKLTVEEHEILKEPASFAGTLSSLQHLTKDFSFGDQLLNDKPSEEENEKTTAETKAESMPLPATATKTTMTTTTHPPPPQPQQSTTDSILIKCIGELEQIMANLIQDNKHLEERLDNHGSCLHKLENLDIPQQTDQFLTDLAEVRKKKKRRHDSPKTPPGSPPHQPPPPPPPAGLSRPLGSSREFRSSQLPPPPLSSPSTNQEESHKLLTDKVDDALIRYNVSKPLPLGGQPGGRPALSISKIKAAYYPDVGLEQMVHDQMWIKEECKYDIAAMDKYEVQMIMRFNEIHKFSDGTLHQIDETLDYRVKEFKVNRMNPGLNTRFWTRTTEHIPAQDRKRLKTKRIFRNLESFVGGRVREAGSKDRPPMLAPGNYVQWKSRIKRYIDTKPNHELIHYYLENPPYELGWKDKEVPTSEGRIDNDIYSTVDACPNACEMWKAIERLKQGESINVQDLETNLYWEFGKFTYQDGKSLESYYSRFYKMMNELIKNQCKSQGLKTVSYHKLYDILKQHQHEVNEIKADKIAHVANPLALVAQQQPVYHPQTHPTHYTQNSSTRSQKAATRNRGKATVNTPQPIYDQEPSMVDEDDETSKDKEIDKLMALISLLFKKISKPTNNNFRTSSNTRRENQDSSLRINRNAGYEMDWECQKPKRAKDVAYHREKMLLCKQEEAVIQLNTEQADWRDDTYDDELEDQELEAHYMYMAQLQQLSPDAVDSRPIFDDEPLQKRRD